MVQAQQQRIVRCVADATIRIRNKKNARLVKDGHNPRSGQETQNPVRCAARDTPSAITHIGCVYADGPSIGRECDLTMTQIKPAPLLSEHSRMGLVGQGKKKSPLVERASNYFLGGE